MPAPNWARRPMRPLCIAAGKSAPLAVVMRMSELATTNAFAAFLYFVASALFIVGLEIPAIAYADGNLTNPKLVVGIGIALVGLAFFIAGLNADALRTWLGPAFSTSVDAVVLNFRYWMIFAWIILILSAIWVIFTKSGDHQKIAALSQQLDDVRRDVDRYAMPRTYTVEEQKLMVDFLLKYPPRNVKVFYAKNSDEALQYAATLSGIFMRGAWGGAGQMWVADNLQPGLSIQFEFKESTNPRPDPRHPERKNLDELIQGMFALVKQGVGMGYSYNKPEEVVIISVGPRPVALP